MLAEHRYYDRLESVLLPREKYKPFPKAQERELWEQLPNQLREKLIREGEERLPFEWPALPAVRYMDFVRNGNRSRYEEVYFNRRQALAQLVMAECAEGQGRFIGQIINGIWCLCEESYWVVPAHMYNSQKSRGDALPDVTDPVIDLFAGETAGLLSWTLYLLEEQLDRESPMIGKRVRYEMKRRILDPFLEREDFWWMGLSGDRRVNNWNPWCNSNCMTAFLICETDESRRVQALRKAMRSLDSFLAVYHSDGGCDEGPGYWSRAGGSLFDCLELLHGATGGAFHVYDDPLVQNIGRYIYRAHISGSYYVNFADGDTLLNIPAELVARYGKRIGDGNMYALGAASLNLERLTSDKIVSLFRLIPSVLNYAELEAERAVPPFVRDVWMDGIQFMAARERGGTDRGLFLAAKGGHNAESHNHNDVGQFIVYADGKPFIIDVGVETYTKKTFSERRYEIWTMRSGYHNLPTIDGAEQQAGKEYCATDVQYRTNDDEAELTLNIASAYPDHAGIASWYRTCLLERKETARIEVIDRFSLTQSTEEIFLSLMTPCEPQWEDGAITLVHDASLKLRIRYDADRLAGTSEPVAVEDKKLRNVWGDKLHRIILKAKSPAKEGTWKLRIERT